MIHDYSQLTMKVFSLSRYPISVELRGMYDLTEKFRDRAYVKENIPHSSGVEQIDVHRATPSPTNAIPCRLLWGKRGGITHCASLKVSITQRRARSSSPTTTTMTFDLLIFDLWIFHRSLIWPDSQQICHRSSWLANEIGEKILYFPIIAGRFLQLITSWIELQLLVLGKIKGALFWQQKGAGHWVPFRIAATQYSLQGISGA